MSCAPHPNCQSWIEWKECALHSGLAPSTDSAELFGPGPAGESLAIRSDGAIRIVGHCSATAPRDEVRRQIMSGIAKWSGHREHLQVMKPQPRISGHRWMFACALALLVASWGCNDDEGTQPPPPDTTPPAVITDFRAEAGLAGTIELTWTAPGDDG